MLVLAAAGGGVVTALPAGSRLDFPAIVLGSVMGGAALGLLASGTAYTLLPALGVYKPIWAHDAHTVGQDLSAHLLLGATTATTAAAIQR